jgi:predicted transcriptional regulator
VTSAQQSSIERIGGALTQAGLARLPSRVFAALLVDDDGRMTSAELAAALEVSAAGVSGAVGYLEQLGMLRRERERGSRRDVYVVDDDAWHDSLMRHDQLYGPIKASFDYALSALGPDAPAHRRVALSLAFLQFIEGELDEIAVKWEKQKAVLGY